MVLNGTSVPHLEVVHQKIKTSTSMNYELQYEEHDEEEIVVVVDVVRFWLQENAKLQCGRLLNNIKMSIKRR
jgi:hypothetical protein